MTAFKIPERAADAHSQERPLRRLDHLDSIRFVAAIWVVISHGGVDLKALSDHPTARLLAAGLGSSFSGISAVMVFFIVSGLCIHFPNVGNTSVSVSRFLIRRYCRIGIPLLVILLLVSQCGTRAIDRTDAVLWSVYAELGYYSIYPLLLHVVRVAGWRGLLFVSGAVSLCVVVLNFHDSHVPGLGWWVWLWGLPIWISGCLLAESLARERRPRPIGPRMLWRATAWASGAATSYLVFHASVRIGYPVSMLAFALFAYFWLQQELQNPFPAWRWLERCGLASYSIYLVHGVVLAWFDGMSIPPLLSNLLRPAMVLLATGAFYLVIEAPSHRLARYLGSRVFMDRFIGALSIHKSPLRRRA